MAGKPFSCVTGLCWLLPIECGTLKNIRYSGVKGIGRCSLSKRFRVGQRANQDCDIGRSGACAGDGAGFQPAYFCSYWCDLGDEPYLGGFTQGEP